MKRHVLILLSFLLTATLWAQEPPRELCVGNTGFASWLPPSDSNGLQGYRLWLDDIELGDIDTTEYQINTDTLQTYPEYTFSVAAVYPDEVSETVSHAFLYEPCSHYAGPSYFKGSFVDENTVELTWRNYTFEPWLSGDNFTTHPGAGYNNGWNVSALHDGLTAYGFNVNRDEGLMVMDKFDTQGSIRGFLFYLYQDATPVSTLTGVYMAIYDGDPLDGGQLIYGNLDENIKGSTYMQHVYRTSEDDFSEVNRPVACITANMYLDGILPGTYWFIATFAGRLKGGVYAVPRTVLGETTTGEARIYNPENGWQPLLDPGTGTQQGISFNMGGPGGGGALPIGYTDLYRDGELIAHGIDPNAEMYIDHDVPHGIHNYSIVNVYSDPDWWECPNKSCPQTIEVRPCYPPKNLEVRQQQIDDGNLVSHLIWEKEDDIPQREDIKSFYEMYRKRFGEDHFQLFGVVAENDSLDSYEFYDTVPDGIYYYRINDYNVYLTGSCQSEYAGQYGDCSGKNDSILVESVLNNNATGALISWGDKFREGELQYDDGILNSTVNYDASNTQWGIKATYSSLYNHSFIRSVSLYILDDGDYTIRFYEDNHNTQQTTLVKQMTVHLTGANQWHTVTLDESYQITYPLWIMVTRQGVTNCQVPCAGSTTSSHDGSWVCYNGNYWINEYYQGTFMVRMQYDNLTDAEYMMQLDEPTIGYQHYNLYRSTDNIDYELIAQLPCPQFNSHMEYFDLHDDFSPECFYYQMTLTMRDIYSVLCETTPMPNEEDPSVDWAVVCDAWDVDETSETNRLILYPNPTTGLLTIKMDGFSHADVYDLMGRLIKSSQQPNIDFQGLQKGLYIIKLMDEIGNTQIRKVIKQ